MTPTGLDDLDDETLAAVDEILGRASHDVAKYMSMTALNVAPEALTAEAAQWLRADLLRTDGSRPAWDLWRDRTVGLAALVVDDEIRAIDVDMDRLEVTFGTWAEEDLTAGVDVARQTKSVAARIVALRRDVRRRRRERA